MNKHEAWSLLKEILRDTQSVMVQRYVRQIPEIEEVLEVALFPPPIVAKGEGETVGEIIPHHVEKDGTLTPVPDGILLSREPEESQYEKLEKPEKPPIRRIKEGSEKVRTQDEVVEKESKLAAIRSKMTGLINKGNKDGDSGEADRGKTG